MLPRVQPTGGTPTTRDFVSLQTLWAKELDSVAMSPMNQINLLKDVSLSSGVTVVNHLLGRKMQGWMIVDIDGFATIYRSQPMNDLTLTLYSSASVKVSLGVF